ncbi:N-acetylmuramoyl-L-alanine amidase [Paenibacillus donghaensis]|nr:N-acetylmuramoyl-L-alanine amidase [Paenibacillus donghaensis]
MRRTSYRVLLLLLLPLLLLSFTGREAAAAAGPGKIIMDNRELPLPSGIVLENVDGSVMIPIRVVVENLGFEVLWEQKSRVVTVQQAGKSVALAVGSKQATSGGVSLDLNAAPKQSGGTVLVPIRFIGEQFGLKVGWDNKDKTVYLTGSGAAVNESVTEAGSLGTTAGTSAPELAVNTPQPSAVPSPTPGATASQVPVNGTATQTPAPIEYLPGSSASPLPQDGNTAVEAPLVKGAIFAENQLIIAASGGVTPVVTKITGPDRIVVDFPGANFAADFTGSGLLPQAGSNGGYQGKLDISGYPGITDIRYALFTVSPPTVRFVIETLADQPYMLSTDAATGLVTIDLNVDAVSSAPADLALNGKPVVVLDAGHGGSQPGAISVSKKQEKDFNFAVIRKAGAVLEAEGLVQVVYTRSEDITLSLADRVKIAETAKASLFVSVHANAMPSTIKNWSKVTGSETYYSRSDSLPLARIMHKHLVAGTGLKDNGIRSKSLHVTRETSMPAVLLEAGYLTNTSDDVLLYSEALQDRLAGEIAAGIKEYLGL